MSVVITIIIFVLYFLDRGKFRSLERIKFSK